MIYADYAAITPLRLEVLNKMLPYLKDDFGNPSSIYEFGQRGRRAIDSARKDIGNIIGCSPKEVIFTGSGTESINLAIKGVTEAYKNKGKHIICTKVEHHAVLHTFQYLEKNGFEITYLETDEFGLINENQLQKAIKPETIFVSIIYANNEIGTIQNLPAIAKIINSKKTDSLSPPFFHTDACQAAEFLDINVQKLGVDLMTLNGSKIYGPKGVGVLYIKKGIKIIPQIHGGGQEYRLRAGTENVAAIVGMAEALKLAENEKEKENARLEKLRNLFIKSIEKKIPKVRLNGHRTKRLPNNINFSFEGIEGETILLRLDMEGICASSGSACTSGTVDPSHVLLAIGVPYEIAHGSVRFTLGRDSTEKDVMEMIEKTTKIVKEMRNISPLYS